MKKILISLLLVSSASMAIDYREMYLEERKKTQAIKAQVDSIKAEKNLYKDYVNLYGNIRARFASEPKKVLDYVSTSKTPVKEYLDYNYRISENQVTEYINSNLITFHKDQIDEMARSIQSNKPSVTVTIDDNYNVYIDGERLTSGSEEEE